MGFVKIVKNKAYFKRFQVQFRRRREAKTDYYARKRLIMNDKNKYDSPKYRMVVRFTNKDVVCQIFSSDLIFDKCLVAAYGHELTRYGLKAGFNNFAATYATGLLLARKVNALKNLPYQGRKAVDGEYYNIGDLEHEFQDDCGEMPEQKPFKAFLDVGLHRTTTGCKLFAAVKGACDGGMNVPHGTKRFPGTDDKGETDFEVVKNYIFGAPVADYMRALADSDEEVYQRQFARYIAAGVKPDDVEGMYKKLHASIRADKFTIKNVIKVTPKTQQTINSAQVISSVKESKRGWFGGKEGAKKSDKKSFKQIPLTVSQKKNRIVQRLKVRKSKADAAQKLIDDAAAADAAAAAAASAASKASGSGSGSGSDSDSD